MGYYTCYTFDAEDIDHKYPDFVFNKKMHDVYISLNILINNTVKDVPFDNSTNWLKEIKSLVENDEMKWYDCETDMLGISQQYPDIYFEIYGDGEDSDDFWVAYFYNGIKTGGQAEIIYPTFDKSNHNKLRAKETLK